MRIPRQSDSLISASCSIAPTRIKSYSALIVLINRRAPSVFKRMIPRRLYLADPAVSQLNIVFVRLLLLLATRRKRSASCQPYTTD